MSEPIQKGITTKVELDPSVRHGADYKELGRTSVHALREKQREIDALEANESVDPNTGLPRQEILRADLKKLVERERHKKPADPKHLALVGGDLVGLHPFNDAFGHSGGDLYLKFIADRLSGLVRTPIDRVYRWGGDEFAVIITDITKDELSELTERVETEINNDCQSNTFPVPQSLMRREKVVPGIRLASWVYDRDSALNLSSEAFLSQTMDYVKPPRVSATELKAYDDSTEHQTYIDSGEQVG
jgi:diguanylate cyclase (GGDEF)-like protein